MRAWQVSVQRYVQPCPFLSFKRSVAVRRKQFWITMASLSPWYKIISSMHAKSCKPLQSCDGSSAKACWECAEKPTSIAEKCWSTRETWIRQSRSLLKTMQHSRHSVYDIRYIGTTLCFSPCKSCTVTYVTYMDVPPPPTSCKLQKGTFIIPVECRRSSLNFHCTSWREENKENTWKHERNRDWMEFKSRKRMRRYRCVISPFLYVPVLFFHDYLSFPLWYLRLPFISLLCPSMSFIICFKFFPFTFISFQSRSKNLHLLS